MASEEVGSSQTAGDVKEEETQFPALRYNFLMQTHFFLLGNANNYLHCYASFQIKILLPPG